MADAGNNYLNIPFKEFLRRMPQNPDGSLSPAALRIAASQEFENYKTIERWARGLGRTDTPTTQIRRSTTQSIANNTVNVAVSFNTVIKDTNGWYEASTPTFLTCRRPGAYLISCSVIWEAGAGLGTRQVQLQVNSSAIVLDERQAVTGGARTAQALSTNVDLEIGDVVSVNLYHNDGAALNTSTQGLVPSLLVTRFGAPIS